MLTAEKNPLNIASLVTIYKYQTTGVQSGPDKEEWVQSGIRQTSRALSGISLFYLSKIIPILSFYKISSTFIF